MSGVVRNRSPMRHPSDSPRRRHPSPRRRSSPRKERSPDHRRTSTRVKSPAKNSSHRSRSPRREKLHERAISPLDVHDRSPRREKQLELSKAGRHRQSKSPTKEKLSQRMRSPIRVQSRSPVRTDRSRSPSPRTKRLRRTQANRDNERQSGNELIRSGSGERFKERTAERDSTIEGKSTFTREKIDGRSSKSTRHGSSVSPSERDRHRRRSSGSPSRTSRDRAREEVNINRGAERTRDHGDDSVSKMQAAEEALEAKQKQKPSFELSGKLAEETNRVRGVALLFTEPPDARKPDVRWRLYVFKAGEVLNEPLYLHRQSSYLFGRERRVADVPTDHPSCSKQHAVIQYRLVEKEQPDGLMKKQVRPYLMDLGSTNGTFINDNQIEAQRYYELFEKDTIRFGNSSREYVMLHENSIQ